MHLPQSTKHVEESSSMRGMYNSRQAQLCCVDQSVIARKVSIAHSPDKASTERGSGMLFVRSFTRDELTDKSDSDSKSSRDSSTTRVQARRRRNLIRRRIGSLATDHQKSLSGTRFDEHALNRKGMHLEGMGLIVKKIHVNDDDSFSSLSYGVHDEEDDSLDSCDQPVDGSYSKKFEIGTIDCILCIFMLDSTHYTLILFIC